MNVFDASALFAFLQGEDGSATVEQSLRDGGACSTANWSRSLRRSEHMAAYWPLARALLASYDLQLEPVTVEDAEEAASTWTSGSGMSLADRLCLALGHRFDAIVWTAQQLGNEQAHSADSLTRIPLLAYASLSGGISSDGKAPPQHIFWSGLQRTTTTVPPERSW